MKREIIVKTISDFEGQMDKGNLSVSDFIVTAILENLLTKKKNIYALSVVVEDENNETYDITVNRDYFVSTLQEQLLIQEKFERYETCRDIIKAIKVLT